MKRLCEANTYSLGEELPAFAIYTLDFSGISEKFSLHLKCDMRILPMSLYSLVCTVLGKLLLSIYFFFQLQESFEDIKYFLQDFTLD